jgi:hypothetical protein
MLRKEELVEYCDDDDEEEEADRDCCCEVEVAPISDSMEVRAESEEDMQ